MDVRTLLRSGLLEAMEQRLQRILAREPNDLSALERLADVYRAKGALARALDTCRQLGAADSTHPTASYLEAVLGGGAIPSTGHLDDVRAAPFVIVDDFLPERRTEVLLEFVSDHRSTFAPAAVDRDSHVDRESRAGMVVRELGGIEEWFLEAIRAAIPQLVRQHLTSIFEVDRIELKLSGSWKGDFFAPHTDTSVDSRRTISFAYYFFEEPKRFEGGDLVLHDARMGETPRPVGGFTQVPCRNNRVVFFPSECFHEVTRVAGEDLSFRQGRFALVGHIHAGGPRVPPAV